MYITKPKSVTRTYIQNIKATPDKVFPLLCPVREADWIDGWNPDIVFTHSGFAEQNCIFITDSSGVKTTWIINRYEPENNYVEMIRFTPGLLVTKLQITLTRDGYSTDVQVTYSYFAVSEEGEAELEKLTEEYYQSFMREWEENINYYLATGSLKKQAEK